MTQSRTEHSVSLTMDRISEAQARLSRTVAGLSDEQITQPSLLPRWTRGHVLTHVARNADGLRNLLVWARTGVRTPQYPSLEVRDAQIEEGAVRPASEIAEDLDRSAAGFAAAAAELSGDSWSAVVQGSRGPEHPAWFTLHRRVFEVEVHHVDVDAGYQPADWPDWFVDEHLYRITGEMAEKAEAPEALLTATDSGRQYFLRSGPAAGLEISGPAHLLLAWLIGRDGGSGLTPDPAGTLPSVPPY